MTKIALLGGDRRQEFLAFALRGRGFETVGFGNTVFSGAPDLDKAMEGAGVVLLPVPATRDGVFLARGNEPKAAIPFSAILARLRPGTLLLGGQLPPDWVEQAQKRGAICADYYLDETVQIRNALPTAEGALRLAMQELPTTLFGSQTVVAGYGRIGSLLSEKLVALGAKVGVLARSSAALAKAELHGAQGRSFLQGVPPFFKDCRVLFNTVPERVFDVPLLSALPRNCILIELASAPGGFDPELANSMGLKVIPAQGLPGRFYPEAAGNILADAVCKILRANGFLD